MPVSAPIAQDHLLQEGTVLFLQALGITFPEVSLSWQQVCPMLPQKVSKTAISLMGHIMETFSESFALDELLALLVALSVI